jgi:hypothetical protein
MIVTKRAISREPGAPINVIRRSADDFDRHPVSLPDLNPTFRPH